TVAPFPASSPAMPSKWPIDHTPSMIRKRQAIEIQRSGATFRRVETQLDQALALRKHDRGFHARPRHPVRRCCEGFGGRDNRTIDEHGARGRARARRVAPLERILSSLRHLDVEAYALLVFGERGNVAEAAEPRILLFERHVVDGCFFGFVHAWRRKDG